MAVTITHPDPVITISTSRGSREVICQPLRTGEIRLKTPVRSTFSTVPTILDFQIEDLKEAISAVEALQRGET